MLGLGSGWSYTQMMIVGIMVFTPVAESIQEHICIRTNRAECVLKSYIIFKQNTCTLNVGERDLVNGEV